MKVVRAVLAGVCVALAATGVQARPWADIQKSGTLIAATGGDLKPFNYFEGKKLTGFEIELTEAIAQKMELKVEWKVLPFDSLLAGLQRDRWDLAISSHGITEERAKVVDFSNPHLLWPGPPSCRRTARCRRRPTWPARPWPCRPVPPTWPA